MSGGEAIVLGPDEGEFFAAGPFAIRSRVAETATGQAFEMYELALGVASVDDHIHRHMDETITVLEGEIEFRAGGRKWLRPAGSVAFIPRGMHHGFSNLGPAPARVLIVFSPSGHQHEYFRELARLFAAPELDAEALRAAQLKYDQELVSD